MNTFSNYMRGIGRMIGPRPSCALALTLVLTFACVPKAVSGNPEDKYYAANALYNKKLYKLAAEEYKSFLAMHPDSPKTPNAKLGLALCEFQMRRYREAEALLRDLAGNKGAPHQNQIHNLLGECLLIAGKPAEAELAFRWSVDRGKEKYYLELPGLGEATSESPKIAVPTDLEPLERSYAGLVEALYQQGKWKTTAKTAAELAKIVPKGQYTPRARFLGALADYNLGNYSEASATLRSLIQADPNFPYREDAYFLLGDSQYKLGHIDEAIKNHEIVARQLKGKLSDNAMFRLGYIKFMQKEYNAATKDFSDLKAIYPKSQFAQEAGIYLGRCYLELQNYSKAQTILGPMAEKGPKRAEATLWLSEVFLRQKKFSTAVDILKPAIRLFATDTLAPNLIFNYATALLGLKQYGKAADEFGRVAEDFKEFSLTPDALRLKAFALNRGGKYPESLACCENFLKKYANDPKAEDVAFLKAENLYFTDKYQLAIKTYRNFIPWEGESKYSREARFRIASALCDMKKWDAALVEMKPLLQKGVEGRFFEQLYYIAGLCEYNQGEFGQAIKDFMKFANEHPTAENADVAMLKSALAHVKLDEKDVAAKVLRKLVATYPKRATYPQALSELGKLLYFQKNFKEAEKFLTIVAADFGQSPFAAQAEYYLAWIDIERGRSDSALDRFGDIVLKYKDSVFAPDALFQSGILLLEKKKYSKAQEVFSKFLGSYPADPKKDRAEFYLAIALSRQGKVGEHSNVFKTFVKNHPKSSLVQRALYEDAWWARKNKKIKEARESYKTLLKAFPVGKLAERATFELAELEYENKNYDDAISLLDRLLAKGVAESLKPRIYYRIAWCLLGRKQDSDALEYFEKLLQEFPDDTNAAVAAYQAGELRLKDKDFETAMQRFQTAVSAKNNAPVKELATLRLGETQTLTDRWDAARQTFETFMAAFPQSPHSRRARLWRGWCLENQKKFRDAISDYEAVLKFNIRDDLGARAQFQIGECQMAMKKYDDAIKTFVLVELNYSAFTKWAARAALELGQCLDRKGDKKHAYEQYKKVVAKYKKTEEAVVAADLIQRLKPYMTGE